MPTRSASRLLKAVKQSAISALLSPGSLRRRIAFEIRNRHFPELDIVVPLSAHVSCPVSHSDAWCSFSEIFIAQEYARAFERMPLPRRWIDLGCYAGFFSAEVLMRRDRANLPQDWEALLVDADSRSQLAVERLAAINYVEARLHFCHGAIAASADAQTFVERPYMASSLAQLNDEPGRPIYVPVLTAAQMLARFPPPYDLIKVDIEGAERDFLAAYGPVLDATRFLLLEWHHWASGGISAEEACDAAGRRQFRLVTEVVARRDCGGAEKPASASCGVLMFERVSPPA